MIRLTFIRDDSSRGHEICLCDECRKLLCPEIIRCKDCEWWNDGRCYCDDVDVRDQEYMVGDMRTEAIHFCEYAGRREE